MASESHSLEGTDFYWLNSQALSDVEFSDKKEQPKRLSYSLTVAVFISLAIHLLLLIFADQQLNLIKPPDTQLLESHEPLTISLLNTVSLNANKDNSESKEHSPVAKEQSVPPVETAQPHTEEKSVSRPAQTEKNTTSSISENKNLEVANSKVQRITMEDIRSNITNYLDQPKQDKTEVDKNFTVFSPITRQNIDSRKEQKLLDIERKQRLNDVEAEQYFEFSNNGGDQLVRIDGRCFLIPERDPFAIAQSDWSTSGSCKNKKKLKFKTSSLSHQYNKNAKP